MLAINFRTQAECDILEIKAFSTRAKASASLDCGDTLLNISLAQTCFCSILVAVMGKHIVRFLVTTLAVTLGTGGVTPQVTQAVRLRDGTVHFVQPPDLIDATTTFNSVNVWGATYYFTINIPEKAGEPLGKVIITQRQGGDNIRYKLDDSRAFEGTRKDKGTRLTLGEVTRDRETRTVAVNFNPPVPPGKTVTIGLRPVKNPMSSGVYLFGVTAFPAGEKSYGQFIGFGRLHFYSDGGGRD